MKNPSLARQIRAINQEINSQIYSYTHRCGVHKGKIPPGPHLFHLEALQAIKETLKAIRAKK